MHTFWCSMGDAETAELAEALKTNKSVKVRVVVFNFCVCVHSGTLPLRFPSFCMSMHVVYACGLCGLSPFFFSQISHPLRLPLPLPLSRTSARCPPAPLQICSVSIYAHQKNLCSPEHKFQVPKLCYNMRVRTRVRVRSLSLTKF